ncbi:MAG: TOBE domain-containing protein [Thiolinea sp.]
MLFLELLAQVPIGNELLLAQLTLKAASQLKLELGQVVHAEIKQAVVKLADSLLALQPQPTPKQ